jgi:hypothetical protein
LEWDAYQIGEFSTLWTRPDRDDLLDQAKSLATAVFREAVEDRCPEILSGVRFYGYVKSRISNLPHTFLAKLVGRMVASACLLHSADWLPTGEPSWNLMAFQRLLPNGPDGKEKTEKEFSKEVSIVFNRDLYLPGLKSALNALLAKEYEWLVEQDWGSRATQCSPFLNRCLEAARSSALL